MERYYHRARDLVKVFFFFPNFYNNHIVDVVIVNYRLSHRYERSIAKSNPIIRFISLVWNGRTRAPPGVRIFYFPFFWTLSGTEASRTLLFFLFVNLFIFSFIYIFFIYLLTIIIIILFFLVIYFHVLRVCERARACLHVCSLFLQPRIDVKNMKRN